jgi:ribosomal protein S27E
MARVIDIKCPTCAAPLPISADATTITCRYCGGTSAVERPGKAVHAPPGQTVVHVPAASPAVGRNVAIGVATSMLAVGVVTSMTFLNSSSPPMQARPGAPEVTTATATATATAGAPPVTYSFDDRPMLADINGDGAPDIVGRVREYNVGAWISAFDGTSGAELWRSGLLGKDAEDGYALRGIAHGRFVAVDALGKVQALDLKTGGPAWSTLLGEKADSICAGEGVIVIETADDVRHGLDPQSGKSREPGKPAACAVVWSSERDLTPTQRIIDWPRFEANGLPSLHSVDGISAHRALVPSEPGPRFLLGSKSKGTAVPMAAAVGDKRKVLWKEIVPGVDPLTTGTNVTTIQAGHGGGVLVIPYDMKEREAGVRMAALAADTGARLWDVQVGSNSPFSGGVVVANDRTFHAIGSIVEVRALKTGELQFTIGKP